MSLVIGDTPEQLGSCLAANAMIVDGKIVTRDDYRALAAQVEALMKVVEGNALVHISANTAEISAQAVKQFVSFIPEYPYGINKSIQEFANQYVELIRREVE